MSQELGTDNTYVPGPNTVFVFGSNTAGVHGAGAALYAHNMCGAEYGVGEGPTGASYALPTKDDQIETLNLFTIKYYVKRFIEFAKANPDKQFFVTRIGCGLAGFRDEQIAPLFVDAPDNCLLPPGWRNFTNDV